jgi:hypothetical protein
MVTVNLSLQQSRRIPYVGVSAISQVPTKLLATRSQQQQQQQRPTTTRPLISVADKRINNEIDGIAMC